MCRRARVWRDCRRGPGAGRQAQSRGGGEPHGRGSAAAWPHSVLALGAAGPAVHRGGPQTLGGVSPVSVSYFSLFALSLPLVPPPPWPCPASRTFAPLAPLDHQTVGLVPTAASAGGLPLLSSPMPPTPSVVLTGGPPPPRVGTRPLPCTRWVSRAWRPRLGRRAAHAAECGCSCGCWIASRECLRVGQRRSIGATCCRAAFCGQKGRRDNRMVTERVWICRTPPPCAPPPRSATCSSRAARRTVAQRHALQPTSGSERRVRGWVRWRPGPKLRRRWPCGTVDSSVCERLAVYRRHGGGHLHHPDRWHLATLRWCRLSHPPLQLAAAAANVPPLRRCCQIVLLPLLPLPHHPFLWLPLATISYPTGGSSPSPGSPAGCLWLGTFPFSM